MKRRILTAQSILIFALSSVSAYYLRSIATIPDNVNSDKTRKASKSSSFRKSAFNHSNLLYSQNSNEKIFEELLEGKSSVGEARFALLLAEASMRDPDSVFYFLQDPRAEYLRRSGYPILFNIWAADDFQSALEIVLSISNLGEKRKMEQKLLYSLAHVNPEAAFRVLAKNRGVETFSDGENLTGIYFEVFRALGDNGIERALSHFEHVESDTHRIEAIMGLAASLSPDGDLVEVVNHLSNLSIFGEAEKKLFFSTLVSRGMLLDDKKTTEALLSLAESGYSDSNLVSALNDNLPRLVSADLARTLEVTRDLAKRDEGLMELWLSAFVEISKLEPGKSASIIDEMGIKERDKSFLSSEVMNRLQNIKISDLITADPTNFREILSQSNLNDLVFLGDSLSVVLSTQGENFIEYLEEFSSNEPVYEAAVTSWLRMDPDLALKWIGQNLDDSSLPKGIRAEFLRLEAWKKPDLYGQMMLEESFSAETHELVSIVTSKKIGESFQAAAKWSMDISDQRLQLSAIDILSKSWVVQDSFSAGDWILNLPPGAARSLAAENIVAALRGVDDESADMWQDFIDGEKD